MSTTVPRQDEIMKCTKCKYFTKQALTKTKFKDGKRILETYLICDGPLGLDLIEECWAIDDEKYCEFYDEKLDDNETEESSA